jgi:hypothetical protein
MFNIIRINLLNILLSAGFYVVVVTCGLLIVKWLWIEKSGGYVFPRGSYKILKDNTDTIKVTNFDELSTYLWQVLSKLDPDYWMDHIGLEGARD